MKAIDPSEYTKYERARMIGSRALQIAMGAPFLIKLSEEDIVSLKYNPVSIAKLEFAKGVIPLTIVRPLPEAITDAADVKEVSKLGKKLVKEIQQTELDTDDGPSMEDSMKEIIEEMKSGDAED